MVDWSQWYVTDEADAGESPEQSDTIEVFRAALKEFAKEREWTKRYVGANAFFGWVEEEPLVRVSPDVYVLDERPRRLPCSWQTWKPGHRPPRFALEIVSLNPDKDYVDGPERYAQLGCEELVLFDPAAVAQPTAERRALTVFQRDPDGVLAQTYAGPGPVRAAELDCWMVVRPDEDGNPRLRLARDAAGTDLIATSEERAEHEAERAEIQTRALEASEARVRELEAALSKLKDA